MEWTNAAEIGVRLDVRATCAACSATLSADEAAETALWRRVVGEVGDYDVSSQPAGKWAVPSSDSVPTPVQNFFGVDCGADLEAIE